MDEYILLSRHQDGLMVASPEQIKNRMKQTRDWIARTEF
jgi:hypothetical protein